jgi:hypothetical protein
MFLEAHCKLGISIAYDKLWHLVICDSHIKKQLCRIENHHDYFSWGHFCQLGESIDYHENGVHSFPFG